MGELVLEKECFVFCEGDKRRIVFDLTDNLANKSRVPLRSKGIDELSIAGLLLILQECNKQIGGYADGDMASALMDILVTKELIRSAAPIYVTEIGAIAGLNSYHLATLMGMINEESRLCSVCHVIGNESDNHWLDYICMVEKPPVLSMLVSDYHETGLERRAFDLVVVDGGINYEKPDEMISEIKRLLKKEGVLICHVVDHTDLRHAVLHQFMQEECEEYRLNEYESIIVAIQRTMDNHDEKEVLKKEISAMLHSLQESMDGMPEQGVLRENIKNIERCIEGAMALKNVIYKDGLICLKEALLDYMLNLQDKYALHYRDKLIRCMSYLENELK